MSDLDFYKSMIKYTNLKKEIAETAKIAVLHHRWYLTIKLIPLAFCSKQGLNVEEKLESNSYKRYKKTCHLYQQKCYCPIHSKEALFP